MPIPRLRRERTAVLIIDVQERLLPTIRDGERIAEHCAILLDIARILDLPAAVSEQYVRGLGRSAEPIRRRIDLAGGDIPVFEKTRFSALTSDTLGWLERTRAASVLLAGVEAHVCVLQTALDLLASGRQVFLATDALASGATDQVAPALRRLEAAGAVASGVLSATYELLADASDPLFKPCLAAVKGLRPSSPGR